MVAYNFKPSFAADIIAGRKTQTIRRERARHARPGEPVQLYRGMRTKDCEKLLSPDPICIGVDDIRMSAGWGSKTPMANITINGIKLPPQDFNAFAEADGFHGVADLNPSQHMAKWWRMTHGTQIFVGVVIRWEVRS